MTLLQKLETGLAARRAELIHSPLARIWGELAKTAEEICREETRAAYTRGWNDGADAMQQEEAE